MSTIYEIIDQLCAEKGISGSKMCDDLGMSRSTLTELRKGRAKTLKLEKASKIADYFGVSVDYLLGNEPKAKTPAETGERTVSDEDIMFALFNGADDITDEMFEEVKRFAQFIQERERKKSD